MSSESSISHLSYSYRPLNNHERVTATSYQLIIKYIPSIYNLFKGPKPIVQPVAIFPAPFSLWRTPCFTSLLEPRLFLLPPNAGARAVRNVITIAKHSTPKQSQFTGPSSTSISFGKLMLLDRKIHSTIAGIKRGMEHTDPSTKLIVIIDSILRSSRMPPIQSSRPKTELTNIAAITSIDTRPTIKQSRIYAGVTFIKMPARG